MNCERVKGELKKRGLPTDGRKKILVERLLASVLQDDATSATHHPHGNDESMEGVSMEGVSMEEVDIIEMSFIEREKEILRKERELLEIERRNLIQPRRDNTKPILSARDVIEFLPEFNSIDVKSLTPTQWLKRVEATRDIYKVDEKLLLFAIPSKLRGPAKMWFSTIQEKCISFEYFKNSFLLNFSNKISDVEIHDKLRHHTRRRDQHLIDYYYEMCAIGSDLSEESVIKYIIMGIDDFNLQNSLRTQIVSTLEQLRKSIEWYNSMPRLQTKIKNDPHVQPFKTYVTKENKPDLTSYNQSQKYIKPQRNNFNTTHCFNCFEEGHFSTNCPKPQRRDRCERCKRVHSRGQTNCIERKSDVANYNTDNWFNSR